MTQTEIASNLARIVKRKEKELNRYLTQGVAEAYKRKAKPSEKSFYGAVQQGGIIAEIKRTSPSNREKRNCDFREKVDPVEIAGEYESAGACAISVLTDSGFKGNIYDLVKVAEVTSLPVLRKDFTIQESQIYESRVYGADAILLIANILETQQMKEYIAIADALGMDCLVESHNEAELEKSIKAGARILGINNRDLTKKGFPTDIKTTIDLLPYVRKNAPDAVVVAESGVETYADIQKLKDHGVKTFLVGTTLMKADNITATLHALQDRN